MNPPRAARPCAGPPPRVIDDDAGVQSPPRDPWERLRSATAANSLHCSGDFRRFIRRDDRLGFADVFKQHALETLQQARRTQTLGEPRSVFDEFRQNPTPPRA